MKYIQYNNYNIFEVEEFFGISRSYSPYGSPGTFSGFKELVIHTIDGTLEPKYGEWIVRDKEGNITLHPACSESEFLVRYQIAAFVKESE